MDVTLTPEDAKGFVPVKLEILISTEEELVELFHRINLSNPSIEEAYDGRDVILSQISQCHPLFEELYRFMNDREIQRYNEKEI